MKLADFGMRALLERAGFPLRGATRADCIHCRGCSRGTVSFTGELAYCHRCKWRANTATLARELGLLDANPAAAAAQRDEARRRAQLDAELQRFDAWREARIREVSDRYLVLSQRALRAANMLAKAPQCAAPGDEAWEALARFFQAEAQLSAAFDWLTGLKASEWLETDATIVEVFEEWRTDAT